MNKKAVNKMYVADAQQPYRHQRDVLIYARGRNRVGLLHWSSHKISLSLLSSCCFCRLTERSTNLQAPLDVYPPNGLFRLFASPNQPHRPALAVLVHLPQSLFFPHSTGPLSLF